MPKYRVETDQGVYDIELDSEPSSQEELHSLVGDALSGVKQQAPPAPTPAPAGPQLTSGQLFPPKPDEGPDLLTKMAGTAGRAAMAIPEATTEAYKTLESAGQPGLSFPSRLGRVGHAALQTAAVPFAPGAQVGKEVAEAYPTQTATAAKWLLPGFQEHLDDLAQEKGRPLTPEEIQAETTNVGETLGGYIAPGAALKGLGAVGKGLGRMAIPGRALAPATELGEALPRLPGVGRALPEIPSPVVAPELTQAQSISKTLEAAQPGAPAPARPLDLGTVGQRLAAERQAPRGVTAATHAPSPAEVPPLELLDPTTTPASAAVPAAAQSRLAKLKEDIAVAKSKGDINSLIGFTPTDVAKGVPAAESMVAKVQDRAMLARALESKLYREAAETYKGLNEAQIKEVNKALDTPMGGATISPELAPVYKRARGLLDEIATSIDMEPNARITDYFPRLREQMGVEARKMIKVSGKDVPVHLTETTPRQILARWFEKARTTDAPADDLGLQPVISYIRGAAHKIGYGGGKEPFGTKQITNILEDISPEIQAMPPRLAQYFTEYVNDVLGVPRATAAPGISPMVSSRLKGAEFLRTIPGPTSPITNLMQQTLTLAEVNPKNFAMAYKDLFKLRKSGELQKLRDLGILDQLGPTEHDFLNSAKTGIDSWLAKGQWLGRPFQTTEMLNRAHAYYAGVREAASEGLSGQAAEDFAKNVVKKTQFLFGKEDMPAAFRDPISPRLLPALGQTSMRQFKNFPIKYTIALKNMVADDMKNLPKFLTAIRKGDFDAVYNTMPSKTGKFFGATAALFGSDAVTMGIDRSIGGDEHWWQTPGLLAHAGMYLGHQAGMSVIPANNFASLLFSIPGPLIGHFLDAASAGASMATGKDVDLSVASFAQGKNALQNLGSLPPIDPEKTANQIMRSIPVGGLALNRIRDAITTYRAKDTQYVRRPTTLPEAFGTEPIPATAPVKYRAKGGTRAEAFRKVIGTLEPRKAEIQNLQQRISDLTKVDNATSARAAQLMIAGHHEEAAKLLKDAGIHMTPDALRNALMGAATEPILRQVLKGRREMRGPILQMLQRMPGGVSGQEE